MWAEFHPYSNVMWVHYLTDKLIKSTRYPDNSTREHASFMRHFRTFLREALQFPTSAHLLIDSAFFADSEDFPQALEI